MPTSIGLTEATVEVTAGHMYCGTLQGAVGPVRIHNGQDMTDPVITRLRDSKRTFFWIPEESGERKLLASGWPEQPGEVSLKMQDMGKATTPATRSAV